MHHKHHAHTDCISTIDHNEMIILHIHSKCPQANWYKQVIVNMHRVYKFYLTCKKAKLVKMESQNYTNETVEPAVT